MMHALPAPIPSPLPPVFSIWCGENGWNGVIAEIADAPTLIPKSASAIGTGLWGLQFTASGALPPLEHFINWVREQGKIPVVELPKNAQGQSERLLQAGMKVAVSPWKFPPEKPTFSTFFYDAPDPTDIPHSDDFSLPVPLANTNLLPDIPEAIEELTYLSQEAKSVISVVALLVKRARENNIIVFPRGSAGGSALVCSLFGVPKHPRALFWRFYFPGRVSLPDIDIDTDQQKHVMQLLSLVCGENKYRSYRLLTSDMRPSCGLLVLPEEFKIPTRIDDWGIAISPFLTKMAERGCKIDILQSYSLGLLRVFEHTVQDMCAIAQTPAPVPRTTLVIPHFRTSWGTTIFNCFRQVSDTVTVEDVALLLALMRPGISDYAGYVLSAKYGCRTFGQLQRYHPKGKIFVFQEDLMRFVAHQFGWTKADEIRKKIVKGSPREKEEAREFLIKIGVDPRAASYTFCFAHAYLYALVCMYFIHQLASHPREVFEFFCSPPVSNTLSTWEVERIRHVAREHGFNVR